MRRLPVPTGAAGVRRARGLRQSPVAALTLVVLASLVACALLPAKAWAASYPDVAKTQWARAYIGWVTDQTVGGQHLLDDFAGAAFKPSQPLTRAQLARLHTGGSKRRPP
jgi:hypothetical protein